MSNTTSSIFIAISPDDVREILDLPSSEKPSSAAIAEIRYRIVSCKDGYADVESVKLVRSPMPFSDWQINRITYVALDRFWDLIMKMKEYVRD